MPVTKPLDKELLEEPFRFEFFQAVRILQELYPDKKGIAQTADPSEEVIRFRTNPSLRFPPSEIQKIEKIVDKETGEERLEMTVNFMGMVGIAGVLPIHYSELVVQRERHKDKTLHAFLDIFSHRMISLFFKAWEKYRFPIQYEYGDDAFTQYLYDWVGLGTKGLRDKMGIREERLLPYGGLIQQTPHSATALKRIIADYFGVPARVLEFFGQWLELDDESVTRLGVKNSRLSFEAIIGTRVWDQQSKIRLVLGPMGFREFTGFLPSGDANRPLKSMTTFMAGLEIDFDVQLVLSAKEVPGCVLTTRALRRPMLGWTSWLKSVPFQQDDDQVVLQLSGAVA